MKSHENVEMKKYVKFSTYARNYTQIPSDNKTCELKWMPLNIPCMPIRKDLGSP